MSEKSGRRSTRRKPAVANTLAQFLADPRRPSRTLRYHELQGFLFAVASAPDLVRPSEWMPEVFGGQEAGFEDLEEAQAILPELMALYNAVNASVASERAALPSDCRFRRSVLANLEADAPVSMWARGFVHGHQWLEEDWDPYVPEEFDQDFGMVVMTLSFFATPTLATAFVKELGRTDLAEAATLFRRAFPDAVAEYARLGRSISKVLIEHATAKPPRAPVKVGRNDPCPCGSGRNYKKCCGAVSTH
jgi:uncharacterized protein